MPTVSQFYGISIRMFLENDNKHHIPHIHAIYGEYEASIDFNGNILQGKFPKKQRKIVEAWIVIHKKELEVLWKSIQNDSTFFTIEPLK